MLALSARATMLIVIVQLPPVSLVREGEVRCCLKRAFGGRVALGDHGWAWYA
jgi:hypothetical protein